jgi:hypothetical protein
MLMGSVVPMVVEQDGRYERSFDIYSRLLRERLDQPAPARVGEGREDRPERVGH